MMSPCSITITYVYIKGVQMLTINKTIIFILLSSIFFTACVSKKKLDENLLVEQNIWHDNYHEEIIVKTINDQSEVV